MLEILGSVLGNVLSGGATGLIGVIAQRWADYQNRKLEIQLEKQRAENALAVRKQDLEIMDREWRGRVEVAQTEGATAVSVADANAFAKSFQMEPKQYSDSSKLTPRQQWVMVGLDALRGAIRPLLTVYLCLLTTLVWFQVRSVLGQTQGMDVAAAMEVWKMVVGQILYLTTTCTLWWFGTRNKSKQPGA